MSGYPVLAALAPELVAVLEPVPGWVWARCGVCAEVRLQRRSPKLGRCLLTPGCTGEMTSYLEANCSVCSRPVTARRRGLDTRFCSKRCEKGAAAA